MDTGTRAAALRPVGERTLRQSQPWLFIARANIPGMYNYTSSQLWLSITLVQDRHTVSSLVDCITCALGF